MRSSNFVAHHSQYTYSYYLRYILFAQRSTNIPPTNAWFLYLWFTFFFFPRSGQCIFINVNNNRSVYYLIFVAIWCTTRFEPILYLPWFSVIKSRIGTTVSIKRWIITILSYTTRMIFFSFYNRTAAAVLRFYNETIEKKKPLTSEVCIYAHISDDILYRPVVYNNVMLQYCSYITNLYNACVQNLYLVYLIY